MVFKDSFMYFIDKCHHIFMLTSTDVVYMF
jgi:hypothetical protein